MFAFAWLATGTAWMWQLTAPGYIVATRVYAAATTPSPPCAAAGRALEDDRPAARPHARRGVALLVAVRRSAARQPGHRPGRRAVRRHVVRVGGVILLTWVVLQVGVALGVLVRRRGASPRVADVRLVAAGLLAAVAVTAVSVVAPRGHGTGAFLDIAAVQGGGEQGTRADDVPSAS